MFRRQASTRGTPRAGLHTRVGGPLRRWRAAAPGATGWRAGACSHMGGAIGRIALVMRPGLGLHALVQLEGVWGQMHCDQQKMKCHVACGTETRVACISVSVVSTWHQGVFSGWQLACSARTCAKLFRCAASPPLERTFLSVRHVWGASPPLERRSLSVRPVQQVSVFLLHARCRAGCALGTI